MAFYVARTLVAMVLNIHDKRLTVIHGEGLIVLIEII